MIGVIAASAAVAALNRLDHAATQNALAIAASMASGVIANFGTDTKPLQAGLAAAKALEAVRFAKAGITGAAEALEGRHGLLRGISPGGKVDLHSPAQLDLSCRHLLTQGLSVKRYPVCYASHRAIDAVIALAQQHDLAPGQVSQVTVSLGPAPAQTLRYAAPRDGLEARLSLHHNVAAALVDRAVGFAQLADAFVTRANVAALYALTDMDVVAADCPEQPGMAKFDRVVIGTHDGRQLDSGPIRHAMGHASNALSDAALDAKFRDCARHGQTANAEALLGQLHRLDELENLRELGQ
jgi:2-methylcitrate dehydratase PrpD